MVTGRVVDEVDLTHGAGGDVVHDLLLPREVRREVEESLELPREWWLLFHDGGVVPRTFSPRGLFHGVTERLGSRVHTGGGYRPVAGDFRKNVGVHRRTRLLVDELDAALPVRIAGVAKLELEAEFGAPAGEELV